MPGGYDMDAAFTSLEKHERGIQVVRKGTCGREKTRLAGSDIVIFMGQCG